MNDAKIFQGDALQVLRTLASGSVHCVVTSPPYWGLRDYGTATWMGGDAACDHKPGSEQRVGKTTLGGGTATAGHQHEGYRDVCGRCGAVRQDHQLGLERTPDEYVARLVDVFREVRRVMRPDATLWLNLGDSYASGELGRHDGITRSLPGMTAKFEGKKRLHNRMQTGLKPKDLVGIPWRVAFALQADGWWLRSEIIWAKRAPMPESVTDRPTRSHEQIFLLSKSARYFYDAEAVKEPSTGQNGAASNFQRDTKDHLLPNQSAIQHRMDREPTIDNGSRNQRDVWTLGPEPFPEAHFAVFPSEIPRRAILAGTSARGCCPGCGAPWERVVSNGLTAHDGETESQYEQGTTANRLARLRQAARERGEEYSNNKQTIGWRPTCDCPLSDPIPCTVLDPFLGSGTTLAVAVELGRRGVGIELNERYIELAHERIGKVQRPLMTF